ncbi:endonuclease/exonuclease/phosphatase family protein [Jiangella asiatica]|nr:endonuclease/exonuclease/phosphatase family protein [Jiangella asiatica]
MLRFATFNIRNGWGFDWLNSWPFRRSATAAAIDALDADVLGLQEVYDFQRRYLDRRLPGERWHGQGRNGGRSGEQCPIAVTDPRLTVRDHRTAWFGPSPATPGNRLPGASFPRIATMLRCRDERSGAEFVVANTHLDERIEANRLTSAEQLAGWMDLGLPAVVLGDLNATPDESDVLGPLEAVGLRRVPIEGGTTHRFSGRHDGPTIDHILVSPHWTVEDAAVAYERPGGRLPSDHWPVAATLRL